MGALYSMGTETNLKMVTNYYQSSLYNSTMTYLKELHVEETTIIDNFQTINVSINGYFKAKSINISQDSNIKLQTIRTITNDETIKFTEDLKQTILTKIDINNTIANPFGSTM